MGALDGGKTPPIDSDGARSANQSGSRQNLRLEPFRVLPGGEFLEQHSSAWAFVLLPVLGSAAFAACAVDGTIGTFGDVHPWDDLRRVLDPESVSPSTGDFTLMRDATSAFLLVIIVLTAKVVWRQWQLFSHALNECADAGVLTAKTSPTFRRVHRVMLVDRLSRAGAECEAETKVTPLVALIRRVNGWFSIWERFSIVPFVFAVLLAILLVRGEQDGVFSVLIPRDDLLPPGQTRDEWLAMTYDSWWAGSENWVGMVTYGAIASIGIYVILLQNLVGLTCVWILGSLSAVAEMEYDFQAPDLNGGWSPMAKAYRTVFWSLFIHGIALSFLVVIIGVDLWWIAALVALWVIVIPLYVWVPLHVFRRVGTRARNARAKRISSMLRSRSMTAETVDEILSLEAEMRSTLTRRLNPLRAGAFVSVPPLIAVVVLPALLSALQILLPLQFGTGP